MVNPKPKTTQNIVNNHFFNIDFYNYTTVAHSTTLNLGNLVSVSGGVPPYNYNWSSSTNNFTSFCIELQKEHNIVESRFSFIYFLLSGDTISSIIPYSKAV